MDDVRNTVSLLEKLEKIIKIENLNIGDKLSNVSSFCYRLYHLISCHFHFFIDTWNLCVLAYPI